ncbi:MAG: GAF domain-containing protein [Anaerolineaceae bacterium]|nr:GAF domain-containing protein [Anaerolineaceae bacterium]
MVLHLPTQVKQNLTNERLNSLYELIGLMNSVYQLPDLLEFVVDRALNLTGGHRGLLLLNDDHQRSLQHIAVKQGQELDDSQVEQALNFVSTTVIKDVLVKGEPRLIRNLPVDRRFEGLTGSDTAEYKNVRSVLAVPLKIAQELVGLIYIDHPRQAIFGQADLNFLSAFASQAALAINRAQTHQRQLDELALLNRLSRSVVEVLDLDEVLTRIVREATRMLHVETGSVLLLDHHNSELYFATSISNGERVDITTRLRGNQGLAGWVVSRGETVCISDVTKDDRWFGEVEYGFVTRSLLAVPLQSERRSLGVLQVLNKKSPSGFSRSDEALLSAFAASATIAIENARLYEEVSQARRLRALNQISLALSQTLSLPAVLNTGLEKSLAALDADAGAIRLTYLLPQADSFPEQITQGLGPRRQLAHQQQLALEHLSNQLLTGEITAPFVMDAATTAGQSNQSTGELVPGIEAVALVSIKAGDKIAGSLVVLWSAARTVGQEELNLLIGIAQIIGLAVQNATHYNQMQAKTIHLTYLNEIGSALTSSLDLDHVLRVNIEGVNSVLKTERTSVFLIDDKTSELVLRHTNEGDTNIRLSHPWQGIAGWVAAHDQPALVNNTLADRRYSREVADQTGYETRALLCVPLKVNGEVIGVVEALNRTDGQEFKQQHLDLLIEFTQWAAIAIHNARLFDELVRAYQHLADEQRRRITAETRGAMAAVILDMAHTMNNIVGAIRVWALRLEHHPLSAPQAPLYQKMIGQIRENAEEAIDLIHRLRDPLDPPELSPTDIHLCLNQAIQSCWQPGHIKLTENYDKTLPLVRANDRCLQAVFHNLLSNAIQAIAEAGGSIEISTGSTAGGQVEIIISDNGPGIPPELKPDIFKPGVSTKSGLGFGLWLVETFVHQFDGSITFDTSEKGTTFRVLLHPWQD